MANHVYNYITVTGTEEVEKVFNNRFMFVLLTDHKETYIIYLKKKKCIYIFF